MTTIEQAAIAAAKSTHAPTCLLNPAFAYVPSNKTDIAETFRRVRERMAGQSAANVMQIKKRGAA